MKKMKLSQSFTIIELMVVMAIIMILAALIVGTGRKARIEAKERKAESMIASLEVAISMYHVDTGGYPSDTSLSTMISALKTDPGAPGWRGPYMEFKRKDYQNDDPATNIIEDPWGNAYNYMVMVDYVGTKWGNTYSYNLWSCGVDKTNDSGYGVTDYDDDIYNW